MGVSNMALHAFDRELATHGAAPAVFNHVASFFNRGGLAHDAPVQRFATGLERLADLDRSVQGGAFFVAGEQEGNVDTGIGMRGCKLFTRYHHRSQ